MTQCDILERNKDSIADLAWADEDAAGKAASWAPVTPLNLAVNLVVAGSLRGIPVIRRYIYIVATFISLVR